MILKPKYIPTHRFQPEVSAIYSQFDINAGNVSLRSVQHVDKFVRDCKEAGVWSKIQWCMPFIGNNLNSAARELVAGAVEVIFNFVEADWNETAGLLGNGATKYIDTGFNGTNLQITNTHLCCYLREDISAASYMLGWNNAAVTSILGLASTSGANQVVILGNSQSAGTGTAPTKGLIYGERTSTTNLVYYKDGVLLNTNNTLITDTGFGNANVFAFARNNNGAAASYLNKRISFLSMGQALSAAEKTAFFSAVTTLQINLGRAV
jgi:hypothetical protein